MFYQRVRAWSIVPYPCIGRFHFLELSISLSPLYPTILKRMIESKHTLLDMGCCFAQDVRKLVSDGAPSENIYGAELRQEFIDLGYDLFRDRDTLKSKFLIGDVFDDSDESEFKQIEGGIDIIYAASFFHLFNWDDQVRVAELVVRLLRPVTGSIVFGRQRGNVNPAEYEHMTNQRGTMFRHNQDSWKKMWQQVGKSTGTQWDVNVTLETGRNDPDLFEADGPAPGFDGNKRRNGDGSLRFQILRV